MCIGTRYLTAYQEDYNSYQSLLARKSDVDRVLELAKQKQDKIGIATATKEQKTIEKEINEYRRFGYDGIIYPTHMFSNNVRHYYLWTLRNYLSDHFFKKYGRFYLAYSSLQEFTIQLQVIFEEIADEYEGRIQGTLKIYDMYDTEAMKADGFEASSSSKGDGWSTNDSKMANLPNVVLPEEEMVYTNSSKVGGHTSSTSDTREKSFTTKLSGVLAYLSFNKKWLREYMNEYSKLFKTTMVWGFDG